MSNFKPTGYGNSLLEGTAGKFFISYNPAPPIGNEGPETALVIRAANGESDQFLILIGDHRVAYEAALERDGFGGCLEYFKANRDKQGSWSNNLPGEEGI